MSFESDMKMSYATSY